MLPCVFCINKTLLFLKHGRLYHSNVQLWNNETNEEKPEKRKS